MANFRNSQSNQSANHATKLKPNIYTYLVGKYFPYSFAMHVLDENAQEATEKLMYRRLAMYFTHLSNFSGHKHLLIKGQIHYTNTFPSSIQNFMMEVPQTVFDSMQWRWKKKSKEHEIKIMAKRSLKKIERNAQITDIDIIFRHNT